MYPNYHTKEDLENLKLSDKYSSAWTADDKTPKNHYLPKFNTSSSSECLSYEDSGRTYQNPFPIFRGTPYKSGHDPCKVLMMKKSFYHSRLTVKCPGDKYPDGYIHFKEESYKLPAYVFDRTVAVDPDQYMVNFYDYYYCGGYLSRFEDGGNSYLVRPLLNNTIWITALDGKKEEYEIEGSEEKQIYNIKVDNRNETNYLSVRQKHDVSVDQISIIEGSLTTIPVWKSFSEIPYIDVKLSPDCHLGILRVNHEFEEHDLENKEILINHKIKDASDNKYDISQLIYFNTSEVVLMSPKVVELFDMRSKDTKTLNDEEEAAQASNVNCCITLCTKDTNYAFLATKHDIVKIDLREMKTIKKWSHGLRTFPIIIKYAYIGEEEYVCVTNGRESMLLFVDAGKDYIPFIMPGASKTHRAFNINVRPVFGDIIEDRIDLSIPGMEFGIKDNDLTIYTTNAAGDVFCYQSNKCEEYNIENSNRHFENWADTLPQEVKEHYGVSEVLDLSSHEESLRIAEQVECQLDSFNEMVGLIDLKNSVNPSPFSLNEIWRLYKLERLKECAERGETSTLLPYASFDYRNLPKSEYDQPRHDVNNPWFRDE